MPPSVNVMDIYFKTPLNLTEIPGNLDDNGHSHVVQNKKTKEVWFCEVGTYEYHLFYKEDPWELVRYTDNGKILSIVERIISLIDRAKI